jgi:hypothetical protein
MRLHLMMYFIKNNFKNILKQTFQVTKHCETYFTDDNHPLVRTTFQYAAPGYNFYVRR